MFSFYFASSNDNRGEINLACPDYSPSIETEEDALQSRIRELSRLPEHDDPPGYKAAQSENNHEHQTSRRAPSETKLLK